jgi:hypothetical protein
MKLKAPDLMLLLLLPTRMYALHQNNRTLQTNSRDYLENGNEICFVVERKCRQSGNRYFVAVRTSDPILALTVLVSRDPVCIGTI